VRWAQVTLACKTSRRVRVAARERARATWQQDTKAQRPAYKQMCTATTLRQLLCARWHPTRTRTPAATLAMSDCADTAVLPSVPQQRQHLVHCRQHVCAQVACTLRAPALCACACACACTVHGVLRGGRRRQQRWTGTSTNGRQRMQTHAVLVDCCCTDTHVYRQAAAMAQARVRARVKRRVTCSSSGQSAVSLKGISCGCWATHTQAT
jgi:hypothetical protein